MTTLEEIRKIVRDELDGMMHACPECGHEVEVGQDVIDQAAVGIVDGIEDVLQDLASSITHIRVFGR